MTTPISSTGSTASTGSAAAALAGTAGAAASADPNAAQFNKDTFLKLLVAQLRFQNPLSPSDGTEYIAQTAQFTMVEQLQEIAKSSAEAALASASQTATSMVGKEVTYMIDGVEKTGTVTAARLDRSGPTVVVAGKDIPIAAVTQVRNASAAAPGTATPGSAAPSSPAAGAAVATLPFPGSPAGSSFVTLGSLLQAS